MTRAEIEEIRGVVTAAGTLDVLLKTGWIRPRGRRKAPGRPITYGTTEAFLSHFGLEEVVTCRGLRNSRAPASWRATCRPASRYRSPPTFQLCATMRTRSNLAILIWASPRRRVQRHNRRN